MLPIPATGILDGIEGIDHVRGLAGIDEVTLTITPGRSIVALPEGDRYLGFVFAGGPDADSAEATLREAASLLSVVVDGEAVPVAPSV